MSRVLLKKTGKLENIEVYTRWAYGACGELMSLTHEEGRGILEEYHYGYAYDAMNRLERAWNYKGEEAAYRYNGMGQRVEKRETSQEGFESPYVKWETTQPFGDTGYRYDGISGSYFAQAREYQPHTGRFMAEDVIRGKITVPKTLNRYGYCLSNPLRYVDLDGNSVKEVYDLFFDYEDFKIDSYGIQIGLHYLYGDGKSIVDIDGRWGNYLMENNTLTEKVGNIVIPIGESLEEGETINVSMTTSMEIENGKSELL